MTVLGYASGGLLKKSAITAVVIHFFISPL
jgi:hypothetical protein